MKEKPKVIELFKGGKDFLLENKTYLWEYLKPVLPFWLALDFLAQVGKNHYEILGLAALPSIYFMACFVLACHRAVLLGPSTDHVVQPFALKEGEGRFIRVVFGLSFLPVLLSFLGAIPIGVAARLEEGVPAFILSLLGVFLIIYFVILCMRFFFVLPARSVNAQMTWKEAKDASRGLLIKWIGAGGIFALVVGIPFVIILSVFTAIVTAVFGSLKAGVLANIVWYALVGVPAFGITVATAAYNVVILSRLYQWAVQERGVS